MDVMSDAFFSATYPKARKTHKCDQCGRVIESGETYRRQGMVYDGRISASVVCLQCASFAEAVFKVGFESEEGGWAWLPDLDSSEVAYCGLSVEHGLYKTRWRDSTGNLVAYPAATDGTVQS
jgi:hypothetical protein